MRIYTVLFAITLTLSWHLVLGSTHPPAFPDARGFGAGATGGRGGDVYHVTTTADDGGPGSLRHAVETAIGPRTIVFEVGGHIDLCSPLVINKPGLTIAGQTAPGGIGIHGYPTRVQNTHDIIIRYVRFRTGDINVGGAPPGLECPNGKPMLPGEDADALSIINSEDVIVDHVSASWGMDETLSVTRSRNITIQHSIISESLNNSFHPEGTHGFGSLVRGDGGGYTFWGNLFAHHFQRSPGVGGRQEKLPDGSRPGLDLDFVNNVIYDWGLLPSHTVRGLGRLRVNYESNVYISGRSTLSTRLCPTCIFFYVNPDPEDEILIFQSRNRIDSNRNGGFDPVAARRNSFVGVFEHMPFDLFPLTGVFVDERFDFDRRPVRSLSPWRAYTRVVRKAGASIARDEVDRRVIEQVVFQAGSIIDSQEDVGGFPADAPPIAPPTDQDRDGMADRWECRHGLDPTDPDDRNGFDLSGRYTNLEIYLSQLARGRVRYVRCR